MNIQANMLNQVVLDTCLLDMDYEVFISLLEIALELVLC